LYLGLGSLQTSKSTLSVIVQVQKKIDLMPRRPFATIQSLKAIHHKHLYLRDETQG
jgi:hypothetical protein